MQALKDYLAARAEAPLIVTQDLMDALDGLAAAGAQLDRLLVGAERIKALGTRMEVARFEEVAQTLGALSREVWAAHGHALTTIETVKQLHDVEQALEAAIRRDEQRAAEAAADAAQAAEKPAGEE